MSVKNRQRNSIKNIIEKTISNAYIRDVDFKEFSDRMIELKFNSEQAVIVWNVFSAISPNNKDMTALKGFMKF